MRLIVGLGNPGIVYSGSRHNAGYTAVKNLARRQKASFKKESGVPSLCARCKIQGQEALLALPLTYMNLSGEAVSRLVEKYRIGPEELLVVCDDLNLEFGALRIRPYGSSGGHKGVASVIECLNSEDFSRLRIGIGRPAGEKKDIAGFVLSAFNRRDKNRLKEVITAAVACMQMWATEGTVQCMNKFNKKGSI